MCRLSPFTRPFLLLSLLLLSPSLCAGIFGDGDPANGPEDSRLGLAENGPGLPAMSWYSSGGTIVCDGEVRGSASLLDLSALGLDAPPAGRVVMTAAHVLLDLEERAAWTACSFDYMGLGNLPGYRVPINPEYRLQGQFSPYANPSNPERGAGDWAFLWLGPEWQPPGAAAGLRPVSSSAMPALNELGLIAWDRSRREMSFVPGCRAVRSGPRDIGGGAWAGQWLDDCDSDTGASGGALIAIPGGELVAVRGGSHWDAVRWPLESFPTGPPAGTRWDVQSFTNYARGIDEPMLEALRAWLSALPAAE